MVGDLPPQAEPHNLVKPFIANSPKLAAFLANIAERTVKCTEKSLVFTLYPAEQLITTSILQVLGISASRLTSDQKLSGELTTSTCELARGLRYRVLEIPNSEPPLFL